MTKDEAKALGFQEMSHFTVAGTLVFELSRDRQLSLQSVDTPNEMLFLSQLIIDGKSTRVDKTIVLANYDYDGPIKQTAVGLMIASFISLSKDVIS